MAKDVPFFKSLQASGNCSGRWVFLGEKACRLDFSNHKSRANLGSSISLQEHMFGHRKTDEPNRQSSQTTQPPIFVQAFHGFPPASKNLTISNLQTPSQGSRKPRACSSTRGPGPARRAKRAAISPPSTCCGRGLAAVSSKGRFLSSFHWKPKSAFSGFIFSIPRSLPATKKVYVQACIYIAVRSVAEVTRIVQLRMNSCSKFSRTSRVRRSTKDRIKILHQDLSGLYTS